MTRLALQPTRQANKQPETERIMNTVQVTMELPRTALTALRLEPASFVADMRIAAAVKWYELERVSQAKAAEIAGLPRAEFIRALDRYGVSPFQSSLGELLEELSND